MKIYQRVLFLLPLIAMTTDISKAYSFQNLASVVDARCGKFESQVALAMFESAQGPYSNTPSPESKKVLQKLNRINEKNVNCVDDQGRSLLWVARMLLAPYQALYAEVLVNKGIDVNHKDDMGENVLNARLPGWTGVKSNIPNAYTGEQFYYAGRFPFIKLLTDHGAKINETNSNGDTLLAVIAQTTAEGKSFNLLMSLGANVNTLNSQKCAPIHYALDRALGGGYAFPMDFMQESDQAFHPGNGFEETSALLTTELIERSSLKVLNSFCTLPKREFDSENDGYSDTKPAIEQVLSKTYYAKRQFFARDTAQKLSFMKGLLAQGVSTDFTSVSVKNPGATLLHIAVTRANDASTDPFTQGLIEGGVNINMLDSKDRTPLMVARKANAPALLALIRAGATLNPNLSVAALTASTEWLREENARFSERSTFFGSTVVKNVRVAYNRSLTSFTASEFKLPACEGYEKENKILGEWSGGYIVWCATADPTGPRVVITQGPLPKNVALIQWMVLMTDKNFNVIKIATHVTFNENPDIFQYFDPISSKRNFNGESFSLSLDDYVNGVQPKVADKIMSILFNDPAQAKNSVTIAWDGSVSSIGK